MLSYGTAGFRGKLLEVLEIIEPVSVFLLVQSVNCGQAMGIQFTASHNVSTDHGMKFCNYDGHSINFDQEKQVEEFVQLYYRTALERRSHEIYVWAMSHLRQDYYGNQPRIVFGTDMRPGGDEIRTLLMRYICQWGRRFQMRSPLIYENMEVTTPMLQWICRDLYEVNYEDTDEILDEDDEQMREMDFFHKFYMRATSELWDEFINCCQSNYTFLPKGRILDYAHGVGQKASFLLRNMLKKANIHLLNVNDTKDYESLNSLCGADDLHKSLLSPKDVPIGLWNNTKYHMWSSNNINYDNLMGISFDGDADRILYWRPRAFSTGKLVWEDRYNVTLFDGDRLMTLMMMTVQYLLSNIPEIIKDNLKISLVHTAYSNGGAIDFWEKSGFKHEYASTGTKHLHPKAEIADIGIYFETNGHGTVLVSDHFCNLLGAVASTNRYARLFQAWIDLSNDLVGDAIRNVLLVEGSLIILGLTPSNWLNLYQEYPYENHKLYRLEKSRLIVEQEDRVIVAPIGMNEEIRKIEEETGGRIILRASGTEDLVRLYVENPDRSHLGVMYSRSLEVIERYLS